MHVITDTKTLGRLVEAMPRPGLDSDLTDARRVAARIAGDGYADGIQVEDLLHLCGLRFAAVANFADLLAVPKQTLFTRPRARGGWSYGFQYLAAPDVAALLIAIERLGFSIDPTPIVDAVRPMLESKKLITGSELRVLWFAQERHRQEPVTISTSDKRFWPTSEVRLPTGYKVEVYEDSDGPQMLTVTAPRHRRLKVAA